MPSTLTVLRLLVAALCLLLCGCRVDAVLRIDVDRSGAGTLALTLRADADAVARATAAGTEPLQRIADAGQRLTGEGWRTAVGETSDGGREVRLSVPFADPDEFSMLTRDLAAALAAPELRPLEPLTLTVTSDRLRLDGAAALQPREGVAELGLTPEEAEALLARNVTYEVQVALPGETVETTAQRTTAGGVLVWDVAAGERMTLHAVGVRPSPSWLLPAALVGSLVAGAVVVLAIGVVVRRARS